MALTEYHFVLNSAVLEGDFVLGVESDSEIDFVTRSFPRKEDESSLN